MYLRSTVECEEQPAMMDPFNYSMRAVELHQRELHARAEQERLARQASGARRAEHAQWWRQRTGVLLIAAGKMLVGPTVELAGPHGCAEPCRCP
jgi:hypothetical protein